jgi:hypothetical protein
MSKSTSRLVNNIKQELLKEELLAKSYEEFKSKNDTVINNKPLVLKEFIDDNLQTEQVDDGHLILDELTHSEQAESAEILVLKDYAEDHKDKKIKTEPTVELPSQFENLNSNHQHNEFTKILDSINKTSEEIKIPEGFEKFNSLDEARQFIKNHFQNNLETFLKENKVQIDEICKKFLIK